MLVLGSSFGSLAQSGGDENTNDSDQDYREDQFYFGVTYDLLNNMPSEMAQIGFSSGIHIGFIRDMPVNDKRNVAIGIGLGYSANSISQNLQISEDNSVLSYQIVEGGDFSKNKFALHLIEMPFEIRFRNSTPESYRFWRVYAGFKLGYLVHSAVKYKGVPKDFKLKGIEDFNSFHYGLTLSVGYDKFNAHIYYALNSVFKSRAELNGEQLDLRLINIGLMLYIL